MTCPQPRHARAVGFTLLELLVVIAIIGLLAAAFGPALFNAMGRGDEALTRGRQIELVAMIEGYERYYGVFPPDDMSIVVADKQRDWQFGADNGKNTGIESLVMHLSWDAKAGGRLDEHEDWLENTDGDKAEVEIPMLMRREKVEVVDAWGTPFAYFSARTGSARAARMDAIVPGSV